MTTAAAQREIIARSPTTHRPVAGRFVGKIHSNESPANLSGVLTFDGASLLTDPGSVLASFQTSTQIAVTIIK